MSRKNKFDPLWARRNLLKSTRTGVLPELAEFDVDKWPDGWRGCWRAMVAEFLPHSESFILAGLEFDVLSGSVFCLSGPPKSANEWKASATDEPLVAHKSEWRKFWDKTGESGANYNFLNDVYGWALRMTLDYWRYVSRYGDHSEQRHGSFRDVPDTYFLNRPDSQRRCRVMVLWLWRFASARRAYHLRIQQAQPASGGKGRPRQLRLGKHGLADLWLILVWPVVSKCRWSIKDVVRAERLHFQLDSHTRPVDTHANPDWENELLQVSAADAEAMRLRCKRLGLEIPRPTATRNPKSPTKPPFFDFVNSFLPQLPRKLPVALVGGFTPSKP